VEVIFRTFALYLGKNKGGLRFSPNPNPKAMFVCGLDNYYGKRMAMYDLQ